jgi:hypothetical protein
MAASRENGVKMKTTFLVIALVLSTLPASAAKRGSPQDQFELSWQSCNLRDDLHRIRLAIDRLHNSDDVWTNTWRNWRDHYNIIPRWLRDHEHSGALGGYEVDQDIVAMTASTWFGFSYDALYAELDPTKSPRELHRVIDRLRPLTSSCRIRDEYLAR